MDDSFLVVGTGALASLVGARLSLAGADVTLAGTWHEGLEAIGRDGIALVEDGCERVARVAAVPVYGVLDRFSFVLVATKSYRTPAVARFVADAAEPGGAIATMQNGLGNREALQACHPPAPVLLAVTSLGATPLAPGRVASRGTGPTEIGADQEARAAAEALAEYMSRAGMPAVVASDVEATLWRKLTASCAINALTALLGVPNGALLDMAETRAEFEAAAREVGRVAEALGIRLGADPVELAEAVARATADNRSSMLRDVERGGPTEIEAINGAVVREGRRLGVPTPVNASLYERILAIASARGAGRALSAARSDTSEVGAWRS